MCLSSLSSLSQSASSSEGTLPGALRTCAVGPLCSRKAIRIMRNTTTMQSSSLARASAPPVCRVRSWFQIIHLDPQGYFTCPEICVFCWRQWGENKIKTFPRKAPHLRRLPRKHPVHWLCPQALKNEWIPNAKGRVKIQESATYTQEFMMKDDRLSENC